MTWVTPGCASTSRSKRRSPLFAANVVQDAVAAEAVVHDADRSAGAGHEPPRQLIGPAAEGVVDQSRCCRRSSESPSATTPSASLGASARPDAAKEEPLVGADCRPASPCRSGDIARVAKCNWSALRTGRLSRNSPAPRRAGGNRAATSASGGTERSTASLYCTAPAAMTARASRAAEAQLGGRCRRRSPDPCRATRSSRRRRSVDDCHRHLRSAHAAARRRCSSVGSGGSSGC